MSCRFCEHWVLSKNKTVRSEGKMRGLAPPVASVKASVKARGPVPPPRKPVPSRCIRASLQRWDLGRGCGAGGVRPGKRGDVAGSGEGARAGLSIGPPAGRAVESLDQNLEVASLTSL